jgi:dihydroxyacetone kinase
MIRAADIEAAAVRAAQAMRDAEDDLNSADGKLGDGDTGQTMRRVAEAVAAAAENGVNGDLGALFRKLGMAGMSATGSSLGTLVSVGLLELGKAFAGKPEVTAAELAAALASAEAVMFARGKAALGDKTALDVLHAVQTHLGAAPEDRAAVPDVVRSTLAAFRDRPCKIGRARMYAEKSIGIDDPGMLAFARIADAIAAA